MAVVMWRCWVNVKCVIFVLIVCTSLSYLKLDILFHWCCCALCWNVFYIKKINAFVVKMNGFTMCPFINCMVPADHVFPEMQCFFVCFYFVPSHRREWGLLWVLSPIYGMLKLWQSESSFISSPWSVTYESFQSANVAPYSVQHHWRDFNLVTHSCNRSSRRLDLL